MKRLFPDSTMILAALIMLCLMPGCVNPDKPDSTKEYWYDFKDGTQGWTGLFADYPKDSTGYNLNFGQAHLPLPLDTGIGAVILSGNNHSDDLLACMFRKIDNLIPNAAYQVTFKIELASNVATNSMGIGGTPDLALGAGGINYQPGTDLDSTDWYRPNFTSALQGFASNEVLQMLGTIGVTDTTTQYALITRDNISGPIELTTNEYGQLWLLIGTDSGFEGITTLYYKSIIIKLKHWD